STGCCGGWWVSRSPWGPPGGSRPLRCQCPPRPPEPSTATRSRSAAPASNRPVVAWCHRRTTPPGRGGRPMRNLTRGAAIMVAAAGGYGGLYRLGQTWGASAQEQRQPLPGDELLANATAWTTHAITIGAPPAAVWPWLVQL